MSLVNFVEYLSFELQYSPHTVSAYQRDILAFQKFLGEKQLAQATKKDIKNYLAHLINSGLGERSINRVLSSLRTFYKFLMITESIEVSPTEGVKSLKFHGEVQIPFSITEISDLLDTDIFDDTFKGTRDKLMLEMLYHTGMRVSELIGLQLSDVYTTKSEIKVLGKGSKERIIPINQNLVSLIEEYLKQAEHENVVINKYLFETSSGKRLYPKFVYRITKSYLSIVSEKSKKSPHMLRHSIATHLLNNGAEINAVKEILGHSSLAATQNYTHNDIQQLKKVFNQTHPRESK